jgi:hypothetical protein
MAYRFDTDLYPQQAKLSTGRGGGILVTPNGRLQLDSLDAVYFRRFEAASRLGQDLGEFRQACVAESLQTFLGGLISLECFQLDPFMALRKADFKELQYKVASQAGLEVPRTLFSNDPDQVLSFRAEVGEVVAKMQAKVTVHRQGEQQAVFTTLLGDDDWAALDGLTASPMTFQEKLEKERELRVTVVGRKVFAAAIDSGGSEAGAIDYRLDDSLSYGWEPWELPEEIAEKLRIVVKAFGLNYSAADFIYTPDGRYVFLEINAAGEWNWLARDLALPIGEAIADVLVSPQARL